MTDLKIEKWKKAITFFIISSIIVSILIFLQLIVFSDTKGIAGKETALLNSKYEDKLCEIILRFESSQIILYKADNLWWGKSFINNEYVTFPLNQQKIASFIKSLSSIRKVYHISDNVLLYKDYKLDENGFFVEARDDSKAILLDLCFGIQNYNGAKISFRTGKSTSIYETESDLSIFLYTDTHRWSDMLLLPKETAFFEETEVLQCSIDNLPIFTESRAELESFLYKLKTYRGSLVLAPNKSNLFDNSHIILIETPKSHKIIYLKK